MTEKAYRVNVAVKDADLAEKITSVLRGDRAFLLVDAQTSDYIELTICQIEDADQSATDYVETLLKSDRVNELFLISENTDPFFLMQIMRLGVKEFFPLPLDEKEFQDAIRRFKDRAGQESPTFMPVKSGEIITVLGSKGGVGTTTVAVNTAVSLSEIDKDSSVALVDLNTLFGDIPLFLDISPKFDWGEVTKNIDRLDNLFLTNVMSKHDSGVHLLPSPAYLNGYQSVTPAIIERLLSLMRNMFDYTIVDCGQSLDASALQALEISDRMMLVAILSMPCLTNANKLIRSLVDMGHVRSMERLNVVINRALKSNEITVKDAEEGIGKDVFWVIPNDYRVTMAAINSGKPILYIDPKSNIAKNFMEMSRQLLPKSEKKKKSGWSLFKK